MILDALFEGKIYPSEDVVPSEPEFREVMLEMEKHMKCLETQLSKEDFEVFEKYNRCVLDIQNLQSRTFFKNGYALGLLTMKEVVESIEKLQNK